MLRHLFFARVFHVKVKTCKKMLSHANIEQGRVNVLSTKKWPHKFNMEQKLANPTLTWNNFRYTVCWYFFLNCNASPTRTLISIDPKPGWNFIPQSASLRVKKCSPYLEDGRVSYFVSGKKNIRSPEGVLPEKLSGGVRPASQNPYSIYD